MPFTRSDRLSTTLGIEFRGAFRGIVHPNLHLQTQSLKSGFSAGVPLPSMPTRTATRSTLPVHT